MKWATQKELQILWDVMTMGLVLIFVVTTGLAAMTVILVGWWHLIVYLAAFTNRVLGVDGPLHE